LSYMSLMLPSLAIYTVQVSMVNDRHGYHASLPLAALLSAGLSKLTRQGSRGKVFFIYSAMTVFMLLWATASRIQIPTWKDSESLWMQSVKVNPGSLTSHYMTAHN
ncbi:MAG: hypothetical protein HY747_02505, partial [Elusimicrobia bacterium]|nr:hypothetical protein [Elusimicrobiota bacterium]